MKYIKNLIKNRKYFAICVILVFTILGVIFVYTSIGDVSNEGIQSSGVSSYTTVSNGIMGLISTTNVGMVVIGLFSIYIGLIFVPKNARGSQDDSDYIVERRDDKIYIKYKDKREFLVDSEVFGPTKLFFRDKNNKFVSMATGYQIYNYVINFHYNVTEKEIPEGKKIEVSEIYNKFANITIMNSEEKEQYIKIKKIKKSNMVKKINEGNMYWADCYVYDKKIVTTSDTDGRSYTSYYIKVTDKNYVVDKLVEVSKDTYYSETGKTLKLVILDETGKDIFDVI